MARATKGVKKAAVSAAPVEAGEFARLEKILQLMGRHGVAELEWDQGGERLRLKTQGAFVGSSTPMMAPTFAAPAMSAPAAASAPKAAAPAESTSTSKPVASNQKTVTSPFVGTFYRQPSPTADPYVREGQTIKRGDVLCIIEAMKLMNEIEAELSGKIITILVENGQPVEFGEALFVVET